MLISSGLSLSFWAESIKCAAYIRNRISTGSYRDRQTPYQKLFGKVPSISHYLESSVAMHICIVLFKIKEGTFIGYEDNSPMDKILKWDNNKVEHSRSVVFDNGSFTRGKSRLLEIYKNPNLVAPTHIIYDPFVINNIDKYVDANHKIIDNISTSDVTAKESESISSTNMQTGNRKLSRPTVRPNRLSYDKLGFLNRIKKLESRYFIMYCWSHCLSTHEN